MGILNVEACANVPPFRAERPDLYELTLLISDAATGEPRDGVGPADLELIPVGRSPRTIHWSDEKGNGLYLLAVGPVSDDFWLPNTIECVGVFVTNGGDRGQTLYRIEISGRPVGPEHSG